MVSIRDGMDMAFGLLLFFVLAGTLLPIGFGFIFNANTTGWSSNVVTLFELLPLFGAVAGILLVGGWAYQAYK